jgi:hypothetical protein
LGWLWVQLAEDRARRLDARGKRIAGIVDGAGKLLDEGLDLFMCQIKVHAGYVVTPLTNGYARCLHIMKVQPGSPMTLGSAAAAKLRLIVWCRDCSHQVEPDPAEMAARYGAETPVLDWCKRLVCSQWASRQVDMVVSGADRR